MFESLGFIIFPEYVLAPLLIFHLQASVSCTSTARRPLARAPRSAPFGVASPSHTATAAPFVPSSRPICPLVLWAPKLEWCFIPLECKCSREWKDVKYIILAKLTSSRSIWSSLESVLLYSIWNSFMWFIFIGIILCSIISTSVAPLNESSTAAALSRINSQSTVLVPIQ